MNEYRILVSIIVPCYNVGVFLDRCIKSLINQTYGNIEILLIDDGSTDKTPILCDNWAAKDSRIIVFHKKNEGISIARNLGIENAIGDYVMFVDSDDYLEENAISKLVNASNSGTYDIIYCGFYKESEEGTLQQISDFERERDSFKHESELRTLAFLIPNSFCSVNYLFTSVWHSLYRRSCIIDNNIRFYSQKKYASEDLLFQIELNLLVDKVKFIPDTLYNYCYNSCSISRFFNTNLFMSLFEMRNKLYKICPINELFNKGIEYHFFVRILDAMGAMFDSSNVSLINKISYVNKICKSIEWSDISYDSIDELNYWKLRIVYKGLQMRNPLIVIVGLSFIKYINKSFIQRFFLR